MILFAKSGLQNRACRNCGFALAYKPMLLNSAKLLRLVALWAFSIVLLAMCGGCSSLLYYPSKDPFTDPVRFRHHPTDVEFTTSDGVHLHGWYFKSPTRPAKATVLYFHGNAQNLTTHFYGMYWALDQGVDYFIFDYRGFGLSDGSPSPEGTVKDGHAALDWINQHKDPVTKLILFGQSLGGAVALRVACESNASTDYDKIIIDSGFMSYRKVAQKVLASHWVTWPIQWLGWLVMSDAVAPEDCMSRISPHPLLVVHGLDDQTVPFAMGEQIYTAALPPKEFWQIEGGRHTDFLFRENLRFQKMLLDWIVSGPKANEKIERFTPVPSLSSDRSASTAIAK